MSQPSGSVCGSAAEVEIGFLLRSSPIICLIDAFFVLWEFAFFFLDSHAVGAETPLVNRLQQARKRLIAFRFQHELQRNACKAPAEIARNGDRFRTTSFSDLLNNRYVRWTIFVFTIPSLVKLYAYRGIIGTQVLATMYLASYIVTELMVIWPRKMIDHDEEDTHQEKKVPSSGLTSLTYIAIAINEILALYCIAVAFRQRFGHPGQSLHQWLCLTVLCAGAVFAIPLFLYSAIHSSTLQPLMLPGLFLPVLFILPLPFIPYLGDRFLPDMDLSARVEQSTAVALCITWVFVLLIFSSMTTRIVRKKDFATTEERTGIINAKKRVELASGCFFLALNITACLLYYMFGYSSEGTSKPAWVEFMG